MSNIANPAPKANRKDSGSIATAIATAQAEKPYPLQFQLDQQSYDDRHVTGTLVELHSAESGPPSTETHLVLDCDRPLAREGAIDFLPARLDKPYVLKIHTRKLGSADLSEATCKF